MWGLIHDVGEWLADNLYDDMCMLRIADNIFSFKTT